MVAADSVEVTEGGVDEGPAAGDPRRIRVGKVLDGIDDIVGPRRVLLQLLGSDPVLVVNLGDGLVEVAGGSARGRQGEDAIGEGCADQAARRARHEVRVAQ